MFVILLKKNNNKKHQKEVYGLTTRWQPSHANVATFNICMFQPQVAVFIQNENILKVHYSTCQIIFFKLECILNFFHLMCFSSLFNEGPMKAKSK